MGLFRCRGWEPPQPTLPLLIHCAAPALERVDVDEAGEPHQRGATRGLDAWARFDPDG